MPEVETTVRGISPLMKGNTVTRLTVRESRFRWPVSDTLGSQIVGKRIDCIQRRAKYILIKVGGGHVLIHLGMSGSIRGSTIKEPPRPYDHVEFEINGDQLLRLRDPRRRGCVLWIDGDPDDFHLLANLGPEPLSKEFNGEYLYAVSQKRRTAVKNMIMDSKVVAGLGNIYASEVLFRAGIHPTRSVNRISVDRYRRLVKCIQKTMWAAIDAGGVTLRDFKSVTGQPGNFNQRLKVYQREGYPCKRCGTSINCTKVIRQRSTYYCEKCQS